MKTKNLLSSCCVLLALSLPSATKAQIGIIVDSFDVNIGSQFALGVAFDGNDLWITGSGYGYIYKYSTSGQLLDSMPDPALQLGDVMEGIVYASGHLWCACYTCDTLYEIDPVAKTVVAGFTGLAPDERASIAYDGANTLYFTNGSDGMGSFMFDMNNGTFQPWGDGSQFARGLFYDNGVIYGTVKMYIVNMGMLMSVINYIDPPTGNTAPDYDFWCVDDAFAGLGSAFDGQYVWQSTYDAPRIYKILFNPAMGTESASAEKGFEVQRNPCTDKVSIRKNNVDIRTVELLDLTGQCVLKSILTSSGEINVAGLVPGIYFLTAYNDAGEKLGAKKIVKR